MESVNLLVPDISCEHCQRAIEDSLGKLAGAKNVKVNIQAKTVHLDYDPQQINLSKIEETLDEIGYTVAT